MLSEFIACIFNGVYLGSVDNFKKNGKYNLNFDGQMTYFTLLGILDALLNDEVSGKLLIKNVHEYYMLYYFIQRQEMPNMNKNEHILEYDVLNMVKDKKALKLNRGVDEEVMKILEKGKIFTRNLLGNNLNNASCLTRLSPVIVFYNNPKLVFKIGIEIASLTHGNSDSQITGGVFSYILCRMIKKDDLIDIVEDCIEEIRTLKEGINVIKSLQTFLGFIDSDFQLEQIKTIKCEHFSYQILLIALLVFRSCKENHEKALRFIEQLENCKEISIIYGNLYGASFKKVLLEDGQEIEFYTEFFEAIERLYYAALVYNEDEEMKS